MLQDSMYLCSFQYDNGLASIQEHQKSSIVWKANKYSPITLYVSFADNVKIWELFHISNKSCFEFWRVHSPAQTWPSFLFWQCYHAMHGSNELAWSSNFRYLITRNKPPICKNNVLFHHSLIFVWLSLLKDSPNNVIPPQHRACSHTASP